MKRTNEQVIKFVKNIQTKLCTDSEEYYTKLINYWFKYDLTHDQEKFLDEVKNKLTGPGYLGVWLDKGDL